MALSIIESNGEPIDWQAVPLIGQGLYVLLFHNQADEAVYDGNKHREKIVIYSKSISIKPGKFEGGLRTRIEGYQRHLHIRCEDGRKNYVFDRCFLKCIVLSLDRCSLGVEGKYVPRLFENFWNVAIQNHLAKSGLLSTSRLSQNHRSEWWFLEESSLPMCNRELVPLAESISNKIELAARVMHL